MDTKYIVVVTSTLGAFKYTSVNFEILPLAFIFLLVSRRAFQWHSAEAWLIRWRPAGSSGISYFPGQQVVVRKFFRPYRRHLLIQLGYYSGSGSWCKIRIPVPISVSFSSFLGSGFCSIHYIYFFFTLADLTRPIVNMQITVRNTCDAITYRHFMQTRPERYREGTGFFFFFFAWP